MASKQANEINNSSKESKADSTGNGKERARSIFLCDVEEEGFKEAKENAKRKMERGVISIPGTAKREASNRNDASEPERNPPPSSGAIVADSFPKEPRSVSLEEVQLFLIRLSLLTQRNPLRNKGNFTCGGWLHLKDKERENWKKLRKRPALMRKKGE